MRKFTCILGIIVACNLLSLFVYNIYPNRYNILNGVFYKITTSKYDKELDVAIDVQEWLSGEKEIKLNSVIFEGYNTKVILEKVIKETVFLCPIYQGF